MKIVDVISSYRAEFTTGNVTTISAATGTAGHLLALRWATANRHLRLRAFEASFLLTTAFGAAQEVGFDAVIARAYTVAHTAATGTALAFGANDGKLRTTYEQSQLTGRIASAVALTAGTHTFDGNPVMRDSVWAAAVGASLNRWYDLTDNECGGILLGNEEGFVVRNTILMGATGVGKWHFSIDYDEVIVG